MEETLCKFCKEAQKKQEQTKETTYYMCSECEDIISYPNISVPVICKKCADKNFRCQHCGGKKID